MGRQAGSVWMRIVLTLGACLQNAGELASAGSPPPRGGQKPGLGALPNLECCGVGRGCELRAATAGKYHRPPMHLRGGGRGHPKATDEEYAEMDGVELTDQQARDLRRHWKRKPEWFQVKKGGTAKLVKTKTILNVMKDRDRLEQKRRKSLPLHLVDLGLAGIAWVRGVIGWDTPSKFRHLLSDRPAALPAETQAALQKVQGALQLADGYAIAREVKPRLVKQLAITNADAAGAPSPAGPDLNAGQRPKTAALSAAGGQGIAARASHGATEQSLVAGGDSAEALAHVGSHTYGEISAEGFAHVLAIAEPREGEVFVDLGSGTGKAALVAGALHPFSKVVGIEFVAPLHEASLRLAAHFQDKVVRDLALYASGQHTPPAVEMILGDLSVVDWSGLASKDKALSSVVFAACTCWSQELLDDLVAKAGKLQKGSRLITMTRILELDKTVWRRVSKTMAHYGRGRMTFFIHEKIA